MERAPRALLLIALQLNFGVTFATPTAKARSVARVGESLAAPRTACATWSSRRSVRISLHSLGFRHAVRQELIALERRREGQAAGPARVRRLLIARRVRAPVNTLLYSRPGGAAPHDAPDVLHHKLIAGRRSLPRHDDPNVTSRCS